jgi:hypothetical protein
MRNPGEIPTRLYGSIDTTKVRNEPRPKQGEEQEDWRDMKVLCWFQTENIPPRQRSSRQKKKFDRAQVALRAKNKQYFCDIAEKNSCGKLLWTTGCPINANFCPDLVFLGDDATWIWNLVEIDNPQAH